MHFLENELYQTSCKNIIHGKNLSISDVGKKKDTQINLTNYS